MVKSTQELCAVFGTSRESYIISKLEVLKILIIHLSSNSLLFYMPESFYFLKN